MRWRLLINFEFVHDDLVNKPWIDHKVLELHITSKYWRILIIQDIHIHFDGHKNKKIRKSVKTRYLFIEFMKGSWVLSQNQQELIPLNEMLTKSYWVSYVESLVSEKLSMEIKGHRRGCVCFL